jgi:hypothetical protein
LSIDNYTTLGAAQISAGVRAGDFAPAALIDSAFERADEINAGRDGLNIFIHSVRDSCST